MVYDGYEATVPIAPGGALGSDDHVPAYMENEGYADEGQLDAASHYYRVTVGGFDVLNVSLLRTGPNLTYTTPQQEIATNGHGICIGTICIGAHST